jgi:hypothetical protein
MSYCQKPSLHLFLSTFFFTIQLWTFYSQQFMLFMIPILSMTASCFPSFFFLCSFSSATRFLVFATLIPVDARENACQVSRFQRCPQRWTAIRVAVGRLITRRIALLRRIGWVQIRATKNEVKEHTVARLRGYIRVLLELWVCNHTHVTAFELQLNELHCVSGWRCQECI